MFHFATFLSDSIVYVCIKSLQRQELFKNFIRLQYIFPGANFVSTICQFVSTICQFASPLSGQPSFSVVDFARNLFCQSGLSEKYIFVSLSSSLVSLRGESDSFLVTLLRLMLFDIRDKLELNLRTAHFVRHQCQQYSEHLLHVILIN